MMQPFEVRTILLCSSDQEMDCKEVAAKNYNVHKVLPGEKSSSTCKKNKEKLRNTHSLVLDIGSKERAQSNTYIDVLWFCCFYLSIEELKK